MKRHLLHVFSTFAPGGPQVRTATLLGALGTDFRHSILPLDGRDGARSLIAEGVEARILPAPPRRGSLATTLGLRRLLRELSPDLLLTYNWGAIDAVLAGRLTHTPVVHHEDGFLPDEADGFKRRRVALRRLLLPATRAVVVPSENLRRIAREIWRLPADSVCLIPNGIRAAAFASDADSASLRAELGLPGEALVLGSCGHLRPEKNPARLIRVLAAVRSERPVHLLVLGDGPERARVEGLVADLGMGARVHLAGHRADPAPYYGCMDVFVLPSDTEQMPVALLEAMAAGLPVASTDVGDVRAMLPEEGRAFVVPLSGDETAGRLAAAVDELIDAPELRARLGAANRAVVEERYTFERMLAAYRALYELD